MYEDLCPNHVVPTQRKTKENGRQQDFVIRAPRLRDSMDSHRKERKNRHRKRRVVAMLLRFSRPHRTQVACFRTADAGRGAVPERPSTCSQVIRTGVRCLSPSSVPSLSSRADAVSPPCLAREPHRREWGGTAQQTLALLCTCLSGAKFRAAWLVAPDCVT